MQIPVRCFTCNKCVAHLYEHYLDATARDVSSKDAMDALHVRRMCCRRMLLTNVNIIDTAAMYHWRDRTTKGDAMRVLVENKSERVLTNIV